MMPSNNNNLSTFGSQNPQEQQQQQQRSENNDAPAPAAAAAQGNVISPSVNIGAPQRKRGRPKKSEATAPIPSPAFAATSSAPPPPAAAAGASSSRPPARKSKGGSVASQLITAKAGECVSTKIQGLARKCNVCVLSAKGFLSQVSLRDPSTGGVEKHQGQFELVTLSGSLLPCNSGSFGLSGGLHTILRGLVDGQIVSGRVAGRMIAASPVEISLVTFPWDCNLSNLESQTLNASAPPKFAAAGQSST